MKRIKKLSTIVLTVCMMFTLFSVGSLAAAETEYPIEIHVMTMDERNDLMNQEGREVIIGGAYLSQNNVSGTNGSICAPFTADMTNMAFVLTSAPGATDYNVQLYAGAIGKGEYVSNYATVGVNNGVYFTGLTIGQEYYLKVSSNTLITSGCTAVYSMVTY